MGTKAVIIAVLALFVIGLAVTGYRFYDYVEHDPRFCGSCHIMETAWKTWQEGSHKSVACKNCHQQHIEDRARIVWRWATSNVKAIPPHTQLNRAVCENCHLNETTQWTQIRTTAGHDVHVVRAGLECLSCHLPSLHATQPKTEACTKCHSHARMNIGGMKAFHCTGCHAFLVAKDKGMEPGKELCLSCHAGLQLKGETFPTGAPMQFECSACHKPHTRPILSFNDCLGCHSQIAENKMHFEMKALTRCVNCHRPHHWKIQTRMRSNGG